MASSCATASVLWARGLARVFANHCKPTGRQVVVLLRPLDDAHRIGNPSRGVGFGGTNQVRRHPRLFPQRSRSSTVVVLALMALTELQLVLELALVPVPVLVVVVMLVLGLAPETPDRIVVHTRRQLRHGKKPAVAGNRR